MMGLTLILPAAICTPIAFVLATIDFEILLLTEPRPTPLFRRL